MSRKISPVSRNRLGVSIDRLRRDQHAKRTEKETERERERESTPVRRRRKSFPNARRSNGSATARKPEAGRGCSIELPHSSSTILSMTSSRRHLKLIEYPPRVHHRLIKKQKQKRDAMGHSIRRLKVQRMVMREMPGRVKDARDAPDAEHGAAPNGMQMSR